jgi:hypothetical protein
MADKQAVFTLRVDTGNSVQDVQNFDQAVQSLNKDLKETQTTASQQTGMDQFESKLNELNERLEAGGMSMRDMTKLMKEYQTLAAQAGQTSPVGQQAIQNAGELKDTIGDLKAATTALASDTVQLDTALAGIETGAAAFQGVQSAIALTGVESSALTETMVKLQATQGLVNAVQVVANKLQKDSILMIQLRNLQEKGLIGTIMQSTIAQKINNMGNIAATGIMRALGIGVNTTSLSFKGLKAALISSGIGAVVVLVGSLVGAMTSLLSTSEKNKKAIEAEAEANRKRMQSMRDQFELQQKMAEMKGQSPLEKEVEEQKQLQKELQELQDQERKANQRYHQLKANDWGDMNDDTVAAYDEEVRLEGEVAAKIQAIKLKALDVQKEQNNQKVKNLQDTYDKINNQYKRDIDLEKARGNSTFQLERDALKNKITQAKAGSEEQKDLENQLKILEINNASELSKKRKDNHDKRMEKLKKQREDVLSELKKAKDDELNLESEKQRLLLEMMQEGRDKELKQAEDNAEKFRKSIVEKSIQDELSALDEQFKSGKIGREKYDRDVLALRTNALNNLSDKEKELLLLNDQKLAIDKAAINKKYDDEEIANKKTQKDKLMSIFLDQFDQERQAAKADYDEKIKILDQGLKDGTISQVEYNLAKEKLVKDLADKEKKIEKDKNDYLKSEQKKQREEDLKKIQEILEGAQKGLDELKKINDAFNQLDQTRLANLAKNRDEDLADLDAKMQAELNQQNLTAEQKKAIEEKFAKQKYDIQQKAFQQEDKINRAKFNRDKALRLAQVGIDTASAIVKGISEYGPPPSPLGIAAIASASIIGLTQALAIMKQQYQSGAAPTPPQMSGASAGNLTGAGASTFTANTNAQTTDLTGFQQGQGQGIPVSQVVVLESDITGTQNKVKLQEVKSSF